MKVEKLVCRNQPSNWFQKITRECLSEYPIGLVDISPYDNVLDIGCNVGGFSQAFKTRFNNILAVDASAYNVEQYSLVHNNKVLHRAASSKDGEYARLKKFMMDGDNDTNTGNLSITGFVNSNNHGWKGDEYEEVETISLDTLIDMVGDVGLLKVDIEGAEFDFLYEKDLSKVNYITGEIHNFLGTKTQNLLFEWIGKTHDEIYTNGNGVRNHFLKMWKRR
jgi:FkbM family methyltransferase